MDELGGVAEVDLGRVVCVGHSAGGHLSLWLAGRRTTSVGVGAAVSLAGVCDLQQAYTDRLGDGAVAAFLGDAGESELADRIRSASPIEAIGAVPQLLVHGGADDIVPPSQSRVYVERARAQGVAVELVELAGANTILFRDAGEIWRVASQADDRRRSGANRPARNPEDGIKPDRLAILQLAGEGPRKYNAAGLGARHQMTCDRCGGENLVGSAVCEQCGGSLHSSIVSRIWLVGRSGDCDIQIDGSAVSGHHCLLSRIDGRFLIEDLTSTAGTFVNGERVTVPTAVTIQDEIKLGTVSLPWPQASSSRERIIRIGRSPDSDVVLDFPNISDPSRIIQDESGLTVEDLGSTNGTAVHSLLNRVQKISDFSFRLAFLRFLPHHRKPTDRQPPRFFFFFFFFVDPMVSWHHARIDRAGGALRLTDLGSRNGTFVNGRRVEAPTTLSLSDTVTIKSARNPAFSGRLSASQGLPGQRGHWN